MLLSILLIAKYALAGFWPTSRCCWALLSAASWPIAMGLMTFEKVGKAGWFDIVLPFQIAMPVFDPIPS